MLITSVDQIKSQVLPVLAQSEVWAYDTETNSLNTRKGKVIGFGITDGQQDFYLVHLAWNGQELEQVLSREECNLILEQLKSKKLVLWNTSFDIRFTKNYFGVDLLDAVYSDGMLAFHTVQEEGVPFSHKPFALKSVAAHFLGEDVVAEQKDLKQSIKDNGGALNEFYKANVEIMAKYCVQDARLTLQLANMFHERIEQEGRTKFYFEDEVMPLLKLVTINMESMGIPVDVNALETSLIEITKDLTLLETEIQVAIKPRLAAFETWFLNKDWPPKRTGPFAQAAIELLGPGLLPRTATGTYSTAEKGVSALPDGLLKSWLQEACYLPKEVVEQVQRKLQGHAPMFNLLSKHHLKKLFFEELKCKPLSYTDTGLPQVDENFLDSVRADFAWVPRLIEYNKLTKIKGTYIERFLEQQENGMFYPAYFQHRTTSGRYGSDLQQMPRVQAEEDEGSELVRKYNNRIRAFFIAGKGYKFVDADYASLEVVVFADDAGDAALLDMIKNDYDFYSSAALAAKQAPPHLSADKKSPNFLKKHAPKARQDAKVYGLGIRYGMEAFKLSKTLDISQEAAEAIIEAYFKTYPKLAEKMNYYEQHAKEYGWVQSKAGRRRHLPRLQKLYAEYGDELSNALEVWKKFHEEPALYERMKKVRREMNNLINNALNFPIQSLAASIVNQASIAIAREFKARNIPAYICFNAHDQVSSRCKTEYAEEVRSIMKRCMENTIKLDAPLTADPCIADNLRDSH